MVLRRNVKETREDKDEYPENNEEDNFDDDLSTPTTQQPVRKPSPTARPKEQHEVGSGEALLQPVGYRIYDDEGTAYDFPLEQETIARAFARIFRALNQQE